MQLDSRRKIISFQLVCPDYIVSWRCEGQDAVRPCLPIMLFSPRERGSFEPDRNDLRSRRRPGPFDAATHARVGALSRRLRPHDRGPGEADGWQDETGTGSAAPG